MTYQSDNPIAQATLFRRTLIPRAIAFVVDLAELAIIMGGVAGIVFEIVSLIGRYDIILVLRAAQ